MALHIREDGLTDPVVIALIAEHLTDMAGKSPPESTHALAVEALRDDRVCFWSAWAGSQLAGCGAFQHLDSSHIEIKSMRTSGDFLRQGVAASLLQHMLDAAAERDYQRASLETGSMASFAPARHLYERFGFQYCEPFADYVLDPNSVFMTREI